jgi:tetratricopeptide (TPR) repeat protein
MTSAIHHAEFAHHAPHLRAEAYRLRGLFAWAVENYAQAEADLRCAVAMARAADNPLLLNFSRGNLGLLYWSQCRLSDAETETQYTVIASRDQKLAFQLLSQLGNAGLISLTQGRHKEAERRLRKQMKMAQARKVEYEIARSHGNLGLTYQSSGRLAEALPLLMTSWRLSKRARRIEALCAISINVSMCLAMLGRTESALRFARLALGLSEQLNAPKFRLAALRALAMLAPDEQARMLLKMALTLAAGRPFDRAACLFDLFRHAESPAEAKRFYAQARGILADIGANFWLWEDDNPAAPPWLPALL